MEGSSPDQLRSRLESLVREHHGHVTRTVRRLLGWRGDVDDVVQEVFLAALRQHGRFRGDSNVKTWLTAIAIRRCRSERRKWWKRWKGGRAREPAESDSSGRDDVAEAVRTAVRQLPAKEREVVVLYYLEEISVADVARLVRASEGAVNVRLHRARKKLGEALGPVIEET